MTVENCIKLFEAYKEQAENPMGTDGNPLRGDMRKHAVEQSKRNVEMMKAHMLKSKKFRDHPILQELNPIIETKSEEKKDGKKSKR